MTSSSSAPDPGPPLSAREWEKLSNIVNDGCVVPVIGPELLQAQDNGRPESMYAVWGRVLAEECNSAQPQTEGSPLLYDVTNRLSQVMNSNDLAYDIDEVIRRRSWPIPATLKRLSAISSFPLYVTTTIDHLLKTALDESRPGVRVQEIGFAPRGDKRSIDLPEDFEYGETPTIFHLFGAVSSIDRFAKTEDDLIEFSWSLIDKQYAPERLYDYLRQKTVLLLGCDFPDWLGRFFIYALNAGRPEGMLNIYYVSEHCESGLADFLRRKRAKVIRQSPAAFVEELHRRWESRQAEPVSSQPISSAKAGAPGVFKPGAVFLSYPSEDRETVNRIRIQLEQANIDTWMDERGLEPGDEFQAVIQENIREASFFVAIISRSLSLDDKPRRYLFKEWKWAEDENMGRRKEDRYLQALVIDNTPPGATFVDRPYRDLHWSQLRDGRLPDQFIELLSKGIRRFRRTK